MRKIALATRLYPQISTKMSLFKNKRRSIFVALTLLVLCLLTYSNSLNNDFMLDDHDLLFADTKIHNLKFLPYYFFSDKWLNQYFSMPHSLIYYRPLAHVIPMICYHFFKEKPFGYHLVNLILFFTSCLVIFRLLNLLQNDGRVSLLATMLFCVHPLNGMQVNYITANVLVIQVISMTASIIYFLLALDQKKGSRYYLVSLVTFIISLLCHETALVLPIYLVLAASIVRPKSLKMIFLKCTPHFFIVVFYLLLRLEHASLKTNIFDNIPLFEMTFLQYFASFAKLIFWYIEKLLFLKGIVLIWVTQTVRENLLLWNLALLFLLGICFYLISFRWRWAIKSLFLVWFMIGFLPVSVSCLVRPSIGFMIEPHWLFFPSIGFFALMALLLMELSKHLSRPVFLVLVVTILAAGIMTSRQNNKIWGDEEEYCQYWLKLVPNFKSVWFYLASAYMDKGQYTEAKKIYQQAIANDLFDYQIFLNLGLMAFKEGDLKLAKENYVKALRVFPKSGIIYNNLGLVFLKENQRKEAEEAFQQAIHLERYLLEPRLNLAHIYLTDGRMTEAIKLGEENVLIDPDDEDSLYVLIGLYFRTNEQSKALKLGRKLLVVSHQVNRLIDAGGLFAQNQLIPMAFAFYNKAMKLDPNNKIVYRELGKLYGNLERFEEAVQLWEKGKRLDPQEKEFDVLITQAQELHKTKK